MASRPNLQEELYRILNNRNVYFQPPASVIMRYPCIRFSFGDPSLTYANDRSYIKINKYEGVIIDYDPDSDIGDRLLEKFPMISFGKPYVANNLNHFPFTLYY